MISIHDVGLNMLHLTWSSTATHHSKLMKQWIISYQCERCWGELTVSIRHWSKAKYCQTYSVKNKVREVWHKIFTIYISNWSKGKVWRWIMLLINIFIKKLMKKVRITKNSTPMSDALFYRLTSNSTLIQMPLSVYINIIVTLFLIYNSLILFSRKKPVYLSS